MVATTDIAAVAAQLLDGDDPTGRRVRYVLGPRDITLVEASAILGDAIGRPELPYYVQFSEDDARKAMAGIMSTDLMEQ